MIEFKPIGVIHTPFESLQGMPIQPAGALSVPGTVDVFVPKFDHHQADHVGWLEQARGAVQSKRADDRFT